VNGPDDLVSAAGDEAMFALLDGARPFAEQAEKDAQEVIERLSKATSLEDRDGAIEMVALVPDEAHRRILARRTAKALGERKDSVLARNC